MLELPDGVHEYDGATLNWHIALATLGDMRYAVLQDTSALERREWLGVVMAIGGTFLAVSLSLALGFFVSNRILKPLRQLAERVREGDGAGNFSEQFPRDEVGALAGALDDYQLRWQKALQREREFSADASHELRNPLAVIRSAAEVIEGDAALGDRGRRAAHRLLDAAQQMEGTITSLLYLVRTNTEERGFHYLDVASCIDQAIGALGLPADQLQRIELDYRARPALAVPEGAIRILVSNLVDNALKYSEAMPVVVTLHADYLVVADAGAGISSEEQAELTVLGRRDRRGLGYRTVAGQAPHGAVRVVVVVGQRAGARHPGDVAIRPAAGIRRMNCLWHLTRI
jgi:signal transduction histidine kinase